MLSMTISTLVALPFILRPCKDSLRVIFFPNKEETSLMHYGFIILLYCFLVANTLFCIMNGLGLETVLTVISTFTSPIVNIFSLIFFFKMCFSLPFYFYTQTMTPEEKKRKKFVYYTFNGIAIFFTLYWIYSSAVTIVHLVNGTMD